MLPDSFRFVFFALIFTAWQLFADTPVVYVGDRSQHRIAAMATDNTGNTYAAGSRIVLGDPQPPSVFPTEKPDVLLRNSRQIRTNAFGSGTFPAANRTQL
jgi:hypothetical protein